MRIVCPACAAAYDVPDGRLLPGRVVRCARCETDWAPLVEEPPPAPTPPPPPEPEPEPPPAEPEPPPQIAAPVMTPEARLVPEPGGKQLLALRAAWALSILVLLAGFWFAYSAREKVMHAWPASMRAYAALGLLGKR